MEAFDPDAPITNGKLFGLPHTRNEAQVVVVGVPFDATSSNGVGSSAGPAAIRAASAQTDLFDRRFGAVWQRGVHMLEIEDEIVRLTADTRKLTAPIIEKGGPGEHDCAAIDRIDKACERVEAFVHDHVRSILDEDKIPAVLGGEHSVSLGAIRACAEARGPIGVLQIDAHMDLRESYLGMRYSHASVMYNVMTSLPMVTKLWLVGVRDYCEGESVLVDQLNRESPGRVEVFYDDDIADHLAEGESWSTLCRRIVTALPERVYVTVDIDGLDPSLCPNTGTPVPGGLSWAQLSLLFDELHRSRSRVVGFDLVEVSPGDDDSGGSGGRGGEWDANVGARVLYRMCGAAMSH